MARKRRIRWDRIAVVFVPLLLLILILCVCCGHKDKPEESSSTADAVSSVVEGTDALPVGTSVDEFVIVIDPGHGGSDGGTTNLDGTRLEKDDNLRIGFAVREALLRYSHVRVIMTRETDEFISLQERCDIANDIKADLFISLHRNAATEGNGIEIWINNDSSGDNTMDKLLANYIMELLSNVGISKNRGIRSGFRNNTVNDQDDNYYVNLHTDMPSCLIEMGFMTSDIDNQNFDNRLDAYADAIALAIVELGTDQGMYQPDAEQ